MSERKSWSEEEDKILKHLYEEQKIHKWAEISRRMESEFGIKGRSGKQCRERYSNHLDNSIKRGEWSRDEEEQLIRMHNSVGNRWAELSRAIPGRSETCVKNKFYSILRRGLRYINKVIKKDLKKYKEFDIAVVFKIVEACEQSYKRKTLNKELMENLEMKKEIIFYGMNGNCKQLEYRTQVKSLVQKMKWFGRQKHFRIKEEEGEDEDEKQDIITGKKEATLIPVDNQSVDYPIQEEESEHPIVKVYEPQPRKDSFQRVQVTQDKEREPLQQENKYSASSNLSKLIVQLGKDSNKAFDMFEKTPREGLGAGDWTTKSFEVSDYDFGRSPRQMVFMDSPYFDQFRSRGSFNSFNTFYPQ